LPKKSSLPLIFLPSFLSSESRNPSGGYRLCQQSQIPFPAAGDCNIPPASAMGSEAEGSRVVGEFPSPPLVPSIFVLLVPQLISQELCASSQVSKFC